LSSRFSHSQAENRLIFAPLFPKPLPYKFNKIFAATLSTKPEGLWLFSLYKDSEKMNLGRKKFLDKVVAKIYPSIREG
jgi:hypothetical protein